ncbi:MAG: hypothetical protein R2865_15680 [Deinococcales bacterium]
MNPFKLGFYAMLLLFLLGSVAWGQEGELERLRAQRNSLLAQVSSLSQQLNQQNLNYQTELEGLNLANTNLSQQVSDLTTQLSTSETTLANVRNSLRQARSERDARLNALTAANGQINELNGRLASEIANNADLNRRLLALEQANSLQLSQWQEERSNFENQLANLRSQLAQSQAAQTNTATGASSQGANQSNSASSSQRSSETSNADASTTGNTTTTTSTTTTSVSQDVIRSRQSTSPTASSRD